MAWGIKCRSESYLDGKREHLSGRFGLGMPSVPSHLAGHKTMVFETRALARAFIDVHYGYIRKRPDLRREPHGWKMPIPVKVTVEVKEIP